ncbi:MAG: PhnD/SsuA/transferrin family substrate-binding protein [Amylibacter sp.]|nr:PhnD/SsuA/transferrin family substrate-binding protein [Amylibacter sp.]
MIASLPMYLRPENQGAHDRYWQLIRTNLIQNDIEAPALLSEGETLDHWCRDDLLLSQTCGMPYRLHLHEQVQLVGTPDYGLPDCPAGYYNSVIIVNAHDTRSDLADFASANLAVNAMISQSGFAAVQSTAKKAGFQFENLSISGGHLTSANMVATDKADIAAIDAMTWHDIQKYNDFPNQIKVLMKTTPTPGLPYICALGIDRQAVAQAVTDAIATLTEKDRDALNIHGLIQIPKADYLAVGNP